MNTGQMILTIGALLLLSTTVLTVNQTHLQQGTILRQTELGIYAISLATSFIQKASNMYYDETSVDLGGSLPISPTPASGVLSTTLGIDAGETANRDDTFDDFDDYNNFNINYTEPNVDIFNVQAVVYYVSGIPPYQKQTATSWFKKMDINVCTSISRNVFESTSNTSQAGVDTIKMSYIFSYY